MADLLDNLLWRILISDKLGIDLVTNREKQLLEGFEKPLIETSICPFIIPDT